MCFCAEAVVVVVVVLSKRPALPRQAAAAEALPVAPPKRCALPILRQVKRLQ
jgi:hypothetical protein